MDLKKTEGKKIKGRFSAKAVAVFIALLLMDLFITMSSTLNPFSHTMPTTDSAVFIYMGQRLREGAIPYLQIFDHKGPMLYAIEWLGLTVGNGNLAGIWFLEVIFMFASLYFMYRTARLFTDSEVVSVAAVALGSELFINAFGRGNLSEEYALPFIAYSLYVFLKFIRTSVFTYPEVGMTGACFGSILLIRANMISVWVSWMPVILILLLTDPGRKMSQKITAILKLTISFAAGMILVMAPFVGWYSAHHALSAMINTYLGYNSQYMGGNPESLSSIGSVIRTFSHMESLTTFIFSIYLVAVTQWSYHNLKSRRMIVCWGNVLYLVVTAYLMSISGRNYSHYLTVLIPCLVLTLTFLLDAWRRSFADCAEEGSRDARRKYWILVLAVMVLIVYQGYCKTQILQTMNLRNANEQDEKVAAEIRQYTNPGDDIYVFENNARFYVETKTHTDTRFVFPPDYLNIDSEIMAYISKDQPKVIVRLNYYEDGSKVQLGKVDAFVDDLVSKGTYTVQRTDYASVYVLAATHK